MAIPKGAFTPGTVLSHSRTAANSARLPENGRGPHAQADQSATLSDGLLAGPRTDTPGHILSPATGSLRASRRCIWIAAVAAGVTGRRNLSASLRCRNFPEVLAQELHRTGGDANVIAHLISHGSLTYDDQLPLYKKLEKPIRDAQHVEIAAL